MSLPECCLLVYDAPMQKPDIGAAAPGHSSTPIRASAEAVKLGVFAKQFVI
jgi:hypothetical protein